MQKDVCIISNLTAEGATILGPALLHGIYVAGTAAASTLTILDGSAKKFIINVATTQSNMFVFPAPIAFSSIVADNTGTSSYSILYSSKFSITP